MLYHSTNNTDTLQHINNLLLIFMVCNTMYGCIINTDKYHEHTGSKN